MIGSLVESPRESKTMLYKPAVRLKKSRLGRSVSALAMRVRHLARGGAADDLRSGPNAWCIREYAPGHSFVDVGCMWGIHGAFTFLAEECGATRAVGVDVYPATPEFERERERRGSSVEFVHGDLHDPTTAERVGQVDVVFCSGVLYHTPEPFHQLLQLRRICAERLILTTRTIPELPGLRHAAVYYPYLGRAQRRLWTLGTGQQMAISTPYEADQGYGNWFWGMTPSCLTALVRTAGFEVEETHRTAFMCTVVARKVAEGFQAGSGDWIPPQP